MSVGEPHAAATLQWLGSLCNFLLEVSLAYCLCWVLARFSSSPAVRFTLWTTFLLGSTTGWLLTLLRAVAPTLPTPRVPASLGAALAVPLQPKLHSKLPILPASDWVISSRVAGEISHVLPLLGVLYLLTLGVLATLALYRQRQLRRALRFRTSAPAALGHVLETLASEMGINACRLWLLPALPSPATTGWRTPCIYLPPECADEDGLALENILRHELAHVRRRDTVWEAAACLCRALLFFHPAIHAALSALHLERELACDLIVLRARPDKRDVYADVLVRFGWKALAPGQRSKIGIAFAASAAVLHSRVQAILAGESIPSPGACALRMLLSGCALCLAGYAAPALWIGFHLPAFRPALVAAVQPAAQSTHQGRQIRALAKPVSTLKAPDPTLPLLAGAAFPLPTGAALLPAVDAAPLREVRYHNESSAMKLEPVAREDGLDEDPPGQPTSNARRKRGKGVSATAVTALVGAAIALHGLLDHDHGHD